jgi:hypothetical protein
MQTIQTLSLFILSASALFWGNSEPEKKAAVITNDPMTAGYVVKYFKENGGSIALSNECVYGVASTIPRNCRDMSDEDFSRFALRLTNCHLSRNDRNTYDCKDDTDIRQCTKFMTDAIFAIYTDFFTKSLDLCRHMQEDMRAVAVDMALLHIAKTSNDATNKMESVLESAQSISNTQIVMNNRLDEQYQATRNKFGELESAMGNIGHSISSFAREHSEMSKQELEQLHYISGVTGNMQSNIARFSDEYNSYIKQSLDSMGDIRTSLTDISKTQRDTAEENVKALVQIKQGINEASKESLDSLRDITSGQIAASNVIGEINANAAIAKERQSQLIEQQKTLTEGQNRIRKAQDEMIKTLDYISWIQASVFGKVIAVESILHYLLLLLVCGFLTNTKYTDSCRIYVYGSIVACIVIERILVSMVPPYFGDTITCLIHYGLYIHLIILIAKSFINYKDPNIVTLNAINLVEKKLSSFFEFQGGGECVSIAC